MKTYLEKLKDPRWQKKRLQVFKRDDFECQLCMDKITTLVVHHKKYLRNKEPWEYKMSYLITLCEKCHNKLKKSNKVIQESLVQKEDLLITEKERLSARDRFFARFKDK